MWNVRSRAFLCIFLIALTIAAALPAYASDASDTPEILTPVEHPGTRINLFDYWLDPEHRWYCDAEAPTKENLTQGINGWTDSDGKYAQLKFAWRAASSWPKDAQNENYGYIAANFFTNSPVYKTLSGAEKSSGNYACPGIVQPVLQGGYPVTQQEPEKGTLDKPKTGIEGGQSLAYLFDPTIEQDGKISFTNVSGLLQQNEQGYYYYDSAKNYAAFQQGSNEFILYKAPAATQNDRGQFFPFTSFADATAENEKEVDRPQTPLKHYFGVTMTTRFIQLRNGKAYNGNDDVTYKFSGDDDVWVYIDDVLVADIGGIHNAISFDINFATGRVNIYVGTTDEVARSTTLYDQFVAAGKADTVEWNDAKTTFADNTYHTLKFFYLERGNGASNMSLEFNLTEVPETYIIKTDQQGEPVADAGFALYAAGENYEIINQTPICEGVTDENGKMVFNNAEGDPLAIDELSRMSKSNHFVLRETQVPDGYRAETPDIKLYILQGQNNAKLLLSADIWGTGVYAMPSVTIRATNDVYKWKAGNQKGAKIEEGDLEKGTLFAVPFHYEGNEPATAADLGDETNWWPVSGSVQDRWKVWQGSSMQNIVDAAKAQETPNIFTLLSDGALGCRVNEIPGKLSQYYFMLDKTDRLNSRYTYAFYFTEGSLDDATQANTYRVYGEDFLREFSAHIYIPDMVNTLYVKKTDGEGNPLDGATFNLYRVKDEKGNDVSGITINTDGSINIPQDVKPYDTAKTGENPIKQTGFATFPSNYKNWQNDADAGQLILEQGEYYLVEAAAPQGYLINEYAQKGIRVVVNETGVFVDAGKTGDGITVQKQAGRIVKGVQQFATGDGLDMTLYNIKAICQTSPTYPSVGSDEKPNWSGSWDAGNPEMHLSYGVGNNLEYGPHELDDGTESPVYLEADAGYLRLQMRQCLEHDKNSTKEKEILGDTDLTQLFSIVTTVVVANEKEGETVFTVGKTVNGTDEDKRREFEFTVKAEKNGQPVDDNTYGEMTFTNGVATFKLRHGESKRASGLPEGTTYVVSEDEEAAKAAGFVVSKENDTGTLVKNQPVLASFTNSGQANLKVTKEVTGSDGDRLEPFAFTVTLLNSQLNGTYGDMTFTDGKANFTLHHGESKVAKNLPSGFTYEVTEGEDSRFLASWKNEKGEQQTGQTATGVLQTSQTAAVTFYNERITGGLQVKKQVVGSESDKQQAFIFAVTLSAPLTGVYGNMTFKDGVASFELHDGESVLAAGIPEGTTYHVTEEPVDGFTTAAQNDTGTIAANATQEVLFTNTKTADPVGGLKVTKRVEGSESDKQQAFDFIVKLTEALTGVYGDMTFENGVAAFALCDGESRTAVGLPAGVGYQVAERIYEEYSVKAENGSGTLAANATAEVLFVNTRVGGYEAGPAGSVKVSKRVLGTEREMAQEFTFVMQLTQKLSGAYGDMTFENGVATFTLRHGQSRTATGLPAGVGYQIAEKADSRFAVSAENGSGTVKDGALIEALFTNTSLSKPPQTGDGISVALLAVLMAAAAAGIAGIVVYSRRKK